MARQEVQGGKKVDTYEQRVEGNRGFTVDVYLVASGYDSHIVLLCKKLDLIVRDANINVARKAMRDAIVEKAAFRWEPWLEIRVRGFRPRNAVEGDLFDASADSHEAHGAGAATRMTLEIVVARWQLAEKDGKTYRRQHGHSIVSEGALDTNEEPRTAGSCMGNIEGEDVETRSCVRDTPEVRAALYKIKLGFDALNEKISGLLSQKMVAKTLAKVLANDGGLLALPPGKR